MKCIHCTSDNLIKKGKTKKGVQIYLCKDCNKTFRESVVDIHCVYCNSKDLVKSGLTTHKTQIYLCHSCGRKFSENKLLPEVIQVPCPNCGGELRYRGWSNNGHERRYRCRDCGKNFSGNLNNLVMKKVEKPCPYCHSENVKSAGKLKSGSKRYFCNDCKKGFSDNTVIRNVYRPEKCPKCGKTHISLCGTESKTGKQRYKCVECGYKFVENATNNPRLFTPHEKECPRCHNIGAKKEGKSGGKQYYRCLKCNHKFLEGGVRRHLTLDEKREIYKRKINGDTYKQLSEQFKVSIRTLQLVMRKGNSIFKAPLILSSIFKGISEEQVLEKFKISNDELQQIVNPYYKRESITAGQKEVIVKFGVGCNIPVEFVAPYIPCSIHLCKEIMSSYDMPRLQPRPIDRVEQHFDKTWLDSFVRS